ncbi:MAG: TRAP transporter small permease subunit [Candidatus Limnocylindria bacterium]
MRSFLFAIDRFSALTGKATSWIALAMTGLISYDIIVRKLSQPFPEVRPLWFTYTFNYDMTYYMYAILFMLGGAYALSRGQHVRGDVFYRLWPVRVQASIDLALYLFAFFPGIIALISVGTQWAVASYLIGERSFTSAVAPAIWPLKFVIPLAGALMLFQGIAETIRAYQAVRTGVWPQRLSDVEEVDESLLAKQAEL